MIIKAIYIDCRKIGKYKKVNENKWKDHAWALHKKIFVYFSLTSYSPIWSLSTDVHVTRLELYSIDCNISGFFFHLRLFYGHIPTALSSEILFYFILFLSLHLWHMKVSRLGIKLELQLPPCTTATATQALSCICHLRCSLWQCWILNLPREGRDQSHNCTDTMSSS